MSWLDLQAKIDMSFLDNVTAFLPLGKKEEKIEHFFALNIGPDKLTAALWAITGKELKIIDIASADYSANEEITAVTDRLLDQVLGLKEIEPQKILFGVPNSWLSDDNLKDEYLKILRALVKELELTPMAYVATSNALIHFLEKQEGVPATAILVGFEKNHLVITVVRAGKLDGVKVVSRGESSGTDIEKALLTFTDVETLPSKILVYGQETPGIKNQLLSFSWMSKLSFLHFPKIEMLGDDVEIKSVCVAGGSEINSEIVYTESAIKHSPVKAALTIEEGDKKGKGEKEKEIGKEVVEDDKVEGQEKEEIAEKDSAQSDFGFVVGDVVEKKAEDVKESDDNQMEELDKKDKIQEQELVVPENESLEIEDFEQETTPAPSLPTKQEHQKKINLKRFIPRLNFKSISLLLGFIVIITGLSAAYLLLLKADVKVYVEPKLLEKDAQVVADPNQKSVNEEEKIIPGQVVETEVSGTTKGTASGKKQIGDPAKGTVVIRNKTDSGVSLSKGTVFSSSNGLKFSLDLSVNIASRSGDDGTWGKATGTVTAASIGADGNLPSGTDFSVTGFGSDKIVAKSEGNFSGGTSKEVTVVSSDDQQKLLATLASDLRKQAQQKLQEKYPNKKILEEALSENIAKKNYSKNVNDQASEFSLNMTIKYKGTAFEDADLRTIVSKLVNTQVPDNFQLDLTATETQADVSKLEKDGKLIFLAKFKAKLIPKIDSDKIRSQIKFKSASEVTDLLKGMENVLGSEIKVSPNLPTVLQRMPFLGKNIKIEVGLK